MDNEISCLIFLPYTLGIQLKVIFLGHSDTGKSKLVDCLSTPVPPGVAETKQEERCETPPGTPVMKRQSVNTFVSPKPSLMTAISAGGYAPGPLHDGQQVGYERCVGSIDFASECGGENYSRLLLSSMQKATPFTT